MQYIYRYLAGKLILHGTVYNHVDRAEPFQGDSNNLMHLTFQYPEVVSEKMRARANKPTAEKTIKLIAGWNYVVAFQLMRTISWSPTTSVSVLGLCQVYEGRWSDSELMVAVASYLMFFFLFARR